MITTVRAILTPMPCLNLASPPIILIAQALVLSCTDMRSVEIIARLEAAVGKPVITSNQAMMFQARQLIGIGDAAPGFGHLLEME